MFDYVKVREEDLNAALRQMCPKALKTKWMRDNWKPENPTWNCCYFVAEFVYWYLAPIGAKPMALRVPSYDTWHRFVIWPNGKIVDLAASQFEDYGEIVYPNARVMPFLQTGCKGPSKRARDLAALLNFQTVIDKTKPINSLEKFYGSESI